VSHHWLAAFGRAGIPAISIDTTNTGASWHNSLLDLKLKSAALPQLREGDLLLVHEPLAGAFSGHRLPLVVFSHGVESRLRQVSLKFGLEGRRLRSLATRPLWARLERATRRGLEAADLVLVLNRSDETYLRSTHQCRGRIFCFRNGVYGAPLQSANQKSSRRILFLGTWIERKGIRLIRSAYQQLRRTVPDLHWRLAGTQVEEVDVRKYLGAEVDPNVEVIPKFSGDEEARIFEGCSLFVLPSFTEGQPLALLEAMNRGLCCVTTGADGQLDLVSDGDNGFLFPVGDAAQLAELLRRLAGDVSAQQSVGLRARFSVAGRSWEAVSDEVVEAVRDTGAKFS
jgi:glycosyltransferase involved in cell wall biosynthesis